MIAKEMMDKYICYKIKLIIKKKRKN